MARPFDPRDVASVRTLQRTGCRLDPEAAVLAAGSPLQSALLALLPWNDGRIATWVEPEAPVGFVQARRRRNGRIWDLVCVAPPVGGTDLHRWQRLLTFACQRAADEGAEQIQAAVPDDETVMTQVLRQLGFAPVGVEEVLRADDLPPGPPDAGAGSPPDALPSAYSRVVDAGPEAEAAIDAIARELVPQGQRPTTCWEPPLGGWAKPNGPARVALAANGAVEAAWRWFEGPGGTWLQLTASSAADARAAVGSALAEGRGRSLRRPIYSSAASAHPLVGALQSAGFERILTLRRLAKHTTARVLEPSWEMGKVREAANLDSAAPTASSER